MKKRLIMLLLLAMMSLSFAIPAMAMEAIVTPVETVAEQTIAPHTEMTRAYFRTYHGQLQFRVWSITNGRWLTEWTTINLL